MAQIQELENIATQVRRDILRMVHHVQSGHPGGSLGCADFMTALYFEVMKHTPQPFDMDGKDQDCNGVDGLDALRSNIKN